MRKYGLLIGVLTCLAFVAGHDYPQDYFALPVNRPIKLSGTFGELRSNHFHAGIDIKTLNGRPGEKIYASAQGYISRIKVAPGGYGNALYIAHPNGYTTVYAHLDRFTPDIKAYVRKKQYELQRFSVDLHPRPDQFQLFQGQHIGYLGNSGSSFGPHLHFEIRRSAGQVPLNPFLFGLPVQDQVRPQMLALKVYYLDDKHSRIHVKDYPVQNIGPGKYKLDAPLSEGAWRVSFGLKVFDQMNGTPNRNGIYSLEMQVDDQSQYAFAMDDMPFHMTRYLNAHLDYGAKHDREGSFHMCYRMPGNALDIYEERGDKGVVELYAEKPRTVTLITKDFLGNVSTLEFEISRDTSIWKSSSTFDYTVDHGKGLNIKNEELAVNIPGNAFYEFATVDYQRYPDTSAGYFAHQHDIGDPGIPLHSYGSIAVKHHNIPAGLRSKAFVARCDPGGELVNCGGTIDGSFMTTRIRSLGIYTVGVDTVPPSIEPVTFKSDMSQSQKMVFRITDNQRIGGSARGLSYDVKVDGKWILMEYDAKYDLLIHRFDEHIAPGEHELKIVVRDDRNNSTVYQRSFTR